MKLKIAVIEDDDLIRSMVRMKLERSGMEVHPFCSAEEASALPSEQTHDLIILDIRLPGMSGEEYLQSLRDRGDDTPVLMLTAKGDIRTRIRSLDSGADDFLAKPFNMDELLARIRALIRRSHGKRRVPSSGVLTINRFAVDIEKRQGTSNQGEISLSEKEAALLSYLIEHGGETLTRVEILEDVWGMDVAPTPRTVDNFILKFRKLFEDNPEKPRHFLSIRSRGYRFDP
jgi:two-component system, OmpR family, alkaline phosphatase synthesis response regulator PhoP